MASLAELMFQSGSQSEQATGTGIGAGVTQGAQLALHAEELQQKQATLMKEKQQLSDARMQHFTEAIQKSNQFKDPAAKKNYLNVFIPKLRDNLQLTDKFSDDTIKSLTVSDENMGKWYTLSGDVQAGRRTWGEAVAIANDPMKLADIPATPEGLRGGGEPELLKQQEQYLGNEAQKARLDQTGNQFQQNQKREQENSFRDFGKKINEDAAARFKPVVEAKKAVRDGVASIGMLEQAVQNGQKPNPNVFKALSRAIAKAHNSGAMSDADVADFQQRPGFTGWTEAKINKWVTGNVDMKLVQNLKGVLSTTASAIDQQGVELAKGIEPQFAAYPGREKELRALSGIDAYLQPSMPKKKGGTGGPVNTGKFGVDKLDANPAAANALGAALKATPAEKIDDALNKAATKLGITVDQVATAFGITRK